MNVKQKAQLILMSRAQLSDKVRRYKKVRWKKPVTMQPDTVWVKMIINIPVTTLRYVTASWCEFTPILISSGGGWIFCILITAAKVLAYIACNLAQRKR